ncbi:glycoside hydrolase family 3 C-terminal domain-containing protein [Brachybacterium muris]|uniref:glycoside hydrolase family 3 C-terminal domain-containing protein n=1 Tax=Brachybacterium muris TaxID=219301 RepID=UPI00223BC90A|nr:glycoside hydrolase family 3 N-terminal domain-containing protein [Brachybacterium muris]MCT1653490.1 glycoside hydrolase family 3 C-terminal domain-containing protein [Brachybacterium muris]
MTISSENSENSVNPTASERSRLTADEKIALTGGRDFWHLHEVPSQELPSIMVTDGPHGLRKQSSEGDHLGLNDSEPATCFPPAVGLAATWSRETAAAVGRAIAEEARSQQVSVVLGPGINIKRSPLCGRNFEYFSEDPHLTGELATAYVDGVQEQGVGTSLKHFAVNNQETDRLRVSAEVDERTLHEIYLRSFRTVVTRAQPWTVMCSYNAVGGTLASENPFLLTEVLRDQWGFEGLVVSDWGAVADRGRAVAAGLDLQMPADPAGEEDLRAGLENGTVDQAAVDRAAGLVEQLIRRSVENLSEAETEIDVEGHHQVALEAARRAIVLLQNDGILPLDVPAGGGKDPGAGGSGTGDACTGPTPLAVIGDFAATPRYQGAGSSHVNPPRLTTALDSIRSLTGTEVPFARGFEPGKDADAGLQGEAVDLARRTAEAGGTVLLFLGLGEDVESEGYDREDMELPAAQVELLEAIRQVTGRVVVLLSNGSAVRLPAAVTAAPGVLETWLLGQAGGEAVADVLFGRANPSGHLAETIPLRLEDTPSYLHFPGDHSRVRYGEGLFVGYRGFDALGTEVAYPFGHGLSYTTFELGDLAVTSGADGLDVTVTVTNTGDRAGRAVVQAYVSVEGSTVTRPLRELKGFGDVTLEPGASEQLSIRIPREDLQFWSVVEGTWVVETGTYAVEVGFSSRDLPLRAEVEIAGDEPTPVVDTTWTVGEVMALPAAQAVLAPLFAQMPIAEDPEMQKMIAQMPLNRLSGLGGLDRAMIQQLVDAVNAAM